MSVISTKPPAGMRDFLPEELERRRYLLGKIEEVYRAHDFSPLETPVLERIEILTGKYGDEGDQLIFRVLKRGEKLATSLAEGAEANELADLGMRYDLTVPLCRVVAEYQADIPKIFKCYQMRPVWRADRPARGRFREFFQCDVDIVGTTSVVAEVDVVSAAAEALEALGFDAFSIRINDRALLTAIVGWAGVPDPLHGQALVSLDKLDKIGTDGVRDELLSADVASEAVGRLLAVGSLVDVSSDGPRAGLEALRDKLGKAAPGEPFDRLGEIFDLLGQIPATTGRVTFDPTLARGLTYYTGAIFEIALPGFSGSVGGGGRYDDLVGMFLGQKVPAVGISLGVERLMMIMEERGMFADQQAGCDVFAVWFPGVPIAPVLALASRLRAAGLRVGVHPESIRLKKQFALAEKSGARVVAVIGPNEHKAGTVGLKRMATGEQVTVSTEEAAERVRGWLGVR